MQYNLSSQGRLVVVTPRGHQRIALTADERAAVDAIVATAATRGEVTPPDHLTTAAEAGATPLDDRGKPRRAR